MSVYLHDIPLPEALARLQQALEHAGRRVARIEDLPLDERCVRARAGRAGLGEPLLAALPRLGHGWLCPARGGYSRGDLSHPVTLPCHALRRLPARGYVDTGDPLPEWANAVIPIENVEPVGQDQAPRPIRAARTPSASGGSRPLEPRAPDGRRYRRHRSWCCRPGTPCARSTWARSLPAGTPRCGWPAGRAWPSCPPAPSWSPIGQPVRPGDIIEYNSLVLAAQVKHGAGRRRAIRSPRITWSNPGAGEPGGRETRPGAAQRRFVGRLGRFLGPGGRGSWASCWCTAWRCARVTR